MPDASRKAQPTRRGRPRGFEARTAIAQAMDVFWTAGFAAASIEELSAAMGLNRPSLYGAFGDKRALFVQAFLHYRQHVQDMFAPLVAEAAPARDKLQRIFAAALDLYLSGEGRPRGSFIVLAASSEAIVDPEIGAIVREAIDAMDQSFEQVFRTALENGELRRDADPRALARVATATVHTLAVRARARVPSSDIEPIIEGAVSMLCRDASG